MNQLAKLSPARYVVNQALISQMKKLETNEMQTQIHEPGEVRMFVRDDRIRSLSLLSKGNYSSINKSSTVGNNVQSYEEH